MFHIFFHFLYVRYVKYSGVKEVMIAFSSLFPTSFTIHENMENLIKGGHALSSYLNYLLLNFFCSLKYASTKGSTIANTSTLHQMINFGRSSHIRVFIHTYTLLLVDIYQEMQTFYFNSFKMKKTEQENNYITPHSVFNF